MSEERDEDDGLTRRRYLTSGAVVAGGSLLAGCAGETDSGSTAESTPTDAETATATETETETTPEDTSYSVEMAPVGEVTFEAVPERWVAYDGGYADMAVALGRADGLAGVGYADRYYRSVYDELPGVDVPEEPLEEFPEVRTKEVFYELDADVHLYDPQMLVNWFDWDEADVAEIDENVAPFFGNLIFRRSDDWHDYRYYTLYEAFEKVAQVHQEQERYESFRSFHDDFLAVFCLEKATRAVRLNGILPVPPIDENHELNGFRAAVLDDGIERSASSTARE